MLRFERSAFRPVVGVLAVVLVFLLAARATAGSAGISLHSLVRDENQVGALEWYVGSISLLGIILWASGSAVALAASFWTDGEHRPVLRAIGASGLLLAVDDGLMFHDAVLAGVTNTTAFEPVVFGVYAAVAAWMAWRFFPFLTPTALLFGAASALMLGGSVLVDLTDVSSVFAEDGLKFAGIAAWAGLAVTQAGHAMRPGRGSPEAVRTPAEIITPH